MSHHEKLVKQSNRVSRRVWFNQELRVISGMALGDVSAAESTIHKGHNAQLHDIEDIAVDKLVNVVGLPVDRFIRSGPIDLESWEAPGKIGEYHRSPDGSTFAYSKMVEKKGSERVIKTTAFTSMPREQVVKSLSEAGENTSQDLKKAA